VLRVGHPGDRRRRQVREDAPLAERREDPVVGPETLRVSGSDEVDLQRSVSVRSWLRQKTGILPLSTAPINLRIRL
jgi:hypothetical protein